MSAACGRIFKENSAQRQFESGDLSRMEGRNVERRFQDHGQPHAAAVRGAETNWPLTFSPYIKEVVLICQAAYLMTWNKHKRAAAALSFGATWNDLIPNSHQLHFYHQSEKKKT